MLFANPKFVSAKQGETDIHEQNQKNRPTRQRT